jgi:hypothetical protein
LKRWAIEVFLEVSYATKKEPAMTHQDECPAINNVYVGTDGNMIVRITPSGSSASVFSTMSNMIANQGGVQFLALTSPAIVPEPSTYVMALAGLVCGGFSIWKRRKRTA